MQAEAIARKAFRWAARALIVAVATGSCGCAAGGILGGKPATKLELVSSADLNNCGKPTAAPLRLRVLQVMDPSSLAGATLDQVWGHESDFFGGSFLSKSDLTVEPGTKSASRIPLD